VPAVTAPISRVASADFDGDGQLDLFVGSHAIPGFYPKAGTSRLFRGTNGVVNPEAVAVAGLDSVGLVQGATWTDLDGDGDPDLVLAGEWGPVRIFRNQKGRLEPWDPPVRLAGGSPMPLSRMSGWWTGIAPGDFDGDGRMDLVVGNWGLNTGYEATPERPLKLYHGALGGGEFYDLIEAYHPTDMPGEVARRGRRALTLAIPPIGERFATHAAFGEALMPDLLATLPAKPAVEVATELRSMLFLNRGDSWEAVPLPPEAQWSPVLGVSVADVNADGFEDVLLSQNFFAMRIEWPRTDAGRGATGAAVEGICEVVKGALEIRQRLGTRDRRFSSFSVGAPFRNHKGRRAPDFQARRQLKIFRHSGAHSAVLQANLQLAPVEQRALRHQRLKHARRAVSHGEQTV
jgi:hypothetical protein